MLTLETAETYQLAKHKQQAYDSAAKEYMQANKTNAIPCAVTETFPYALEVTNDLRSAIEVYEFLHMPPKRYFCYVNQEKRTVTTWTGQKIGDASFGQQFRAVFGDIRVPVHVWAVNGNKYYGIYYKSAGDYARITMFKGPQKD